MKSFSSEFLAQMGQKELWEEDMKRLKNADDDGCSTYNLVWKAYLAGYAGCENFELPIADVLLLQRSQHRDAPKPLVAGVYLHSDYDIEDCGGVSHIVPASFFTVFFFVLCTFQRGPKIEGIKNASTRLFIAVFFYFSNLFSSSLCCDDLRDKELGST